MCAMLVCQLCDLMLFEYLETFEKSQYQLELANLHLCNFLTNDKVEREVALQVGRE